MKRIINILIFIFFLIYSTYAQKPNLQFKRVSTEQGLSQGSINVLIQDRHGFIWAGTQDGLNRYDGYTFQVFKPDKSNPHSISHGIIKSLLESKDGTIWAGTGGGGLNKYDPKTGKFTVYQHRENDISSLSNNAVYALYEDKDSVLWVGTFGGGLCRFNKKTETFTSYKYKENDTFSLGGNAIRSIFEDNNGDLWIGVDGGGMNKVVKNNGKIQFIRYQHDPNNPESLGSDIVLTVTVDKEGYFWIGSWAGGISKFNPKTGKAKVYKHNSNDPNSIASNETFSFCEDSDGKLWVSTRNGLDLFDREKEIFYHYKNDPLDPTSLSHNVIIYLFEDRSGVLWIGTEGGGMNLYDLKKKKFALYKNDYKDKTSLAHNEVSSMYADSRGYYWIGTTAGGVDRFDMSTGTFEHFQHNPMNDNSISNNFIQSITEDSEGNMWFGTNGGGVNKYNVQTGNISRFYEDVGNNDALQNNSVTSLIADDYGNVWMSTYGGGINKYVLSESKFVHYTIDAENQMMNVSQALFKDSDGIIWAGTIGHGLAKYNPKKSSFEYYTNSEYDSTSISSNLIVTISECEEGYLWIGTNGSGFDRFDKRSQTFKNFNAKNGLINEMITAIVPDGKGNLWITTVKGMSKFNKKTEEFRNYTVLDGLQGNSFILNSALKNTEGQIFIGGTNGFNVFYPDSIKDNPVEPLISITDFKVFNESVMPGSKDYLPFSIIETNELNLSHKEYVFSFEFSALHFASSTQNQYQYKMEGFDEDWVTTTYDRRFASYSNLSGGEYTFRVRGSNNDGVWNEKGASLKIIITPPFYKTTWFYALVAFLLIFIVFVLFKMKEKATKENERKLKQQIDNAIGEVEKQKQEILEQNKELQKKQEEEKERQWFNEGVALFTDIMRQHKNNIADLANSVLQNIVRYIDANQGGIFIVNDDNEADKYLQLIASYAYSGEKHATKRIEFGEGLVGNCFIEKHTKKINNIPDNYLVGSGLGKSKPAQIVIVPLLLDELIYGVLEIASFNEITKLHIEFIEKIAENVTSQLFTTKISQKTAELLAQSQHQAKELKIKEEEARMNIEQVEADREEALRLRSEAFSYLNSMNHSIIRADFNVDGLCSYANTKFLSRFGYKSAEVTKRHVTEFFPESDRADFQEKWNALLAGSTHIEEKFVHKTMDSTIELLSTFSVVKDSKGEIQKILFLGLDTENTNEQTMFCDAEKSVLSAILLRAEVTVEGIITSANKSFYSLFNKTRHEIIGKAITFFMNNVQISHFYEKWDFILKGNVYEDQIFIDNNTGKRYFYAFYIPILNSENNVEKVIFMSFDITKQKKIELEANKQLDKAFMLEIVMKKRLMLLQKELNELKN